MDDGRPEAVGRRLDLASGQPLLSDPSHSVTLQPPAARPLPPMHADGRRFRTEKRQLIADNWFSDTDSFWKKYLTASRSSLYP